MFVRHDLAILIGMHINNTVFNDAALQFQSIEMEKASTCSYNMIGRHSLKRQKAICQTIAFAQIIRLILLFCYHHLTLGLCPTYSKCAESITVLIPEFLPAIKTIISGLMIYNSHL